MGLSEVETLRGEMMAAGRRLRDALRQEGEVNRLLAHNTQQEIWQQLKVVRKLVENAQEQYDLSSDIYRQALLNEGGENARLGVAVYRAIYGSGSDGRRPLQTLTPIQIIVDRGNVTLDGVVASQTDKDSARDRARKVDGVVSVTNRLRVDSR